jgi:hypothetical protein
VIARHPVLRTRFVWPAGGEPLQVVERHVRMPFEVHACIVRVAPGSSDTTSIDAQYDDA